MPAPRSEKSLAAKVAIHTRWANTTDRTAATAPARTAFDAWFESDDPDGLLTPEQRAAMAESARKAYFATLSHRAAKARRLAAEARAAEAALRREQRAAETGAPAAGSVAVTS